MQDGGKGGELSDIYSGGVQAWHTNEMHSHGDVDSAVDSTLSPLHRPGGRCNSRRLSRTEMAATLDSGNLIIRRGPGMGIQDVGDSGDQEFFNRDTMLSHVVNYDHRYNSLAPRDSVINLPDEQDRVDGRVLAGLTPFVGE